MYSENEIREAGLHEFRNYLRQLWAHLGLPAPTPVQLSIADTLQYAPEQIPNGDRLIIQAFRGVGKSWLTAGFCTWNYLLRPTTKILVVSASQPLADNFSIFVKSLITGFPLLQHLGLNPDRSSNLMWDLACVQTEPAPSMKSAGITGQITGSRADIIIPDDIEIPNNSFTHLKREKLAAAVTEFDQVIKPGGRIIYLGTPHTESSLYRKLEERNYVTRIWPIEVPKSEKLGIYGPRLSPFITRMISQGLPPATPVEPSRFPEEELFKRRAQGQANYALQNMLDTSPADVDAHPLKLKDLIVLDLDAKRGPVALAWGGSKDLILEDLPAGGFDGDCYHRPAWRSPEMTEWQGTVMYVDPSAGGKDETSYSIVRYLHGTLYWVDCGGFVDGFAEATLSAIAAAGARHGNNYVIVESNYGGGMYAELLKPHLTRQGGGKIDDEYNAWSKGQKELRICDTLQPVLESHRLCVDTRVITKDLEVQAESDKYSVVYQLTRMKREKGALAHEDRLESLAGAVAYWTERMARDQNAARDEHLEELRMKDLERFMANQYNVGGWLQKESVWHEVEPDTFTP